jgi:WD40 repeat protein
MSGTSGPPPGDPRQPLKGPPDDPTEPLQPWQKRLMMPPPYPEPALPAPHPGELALPPAEPEELALPPPTGMYLLPAPGMTSSSSQTGATAASPATPLLLPPGRPTNPWRDSRRWTMGLLMVSLALLVVCALPVWVFGVWSVWAGNSHLPPPVVATLDPNGQGASAAVWSPDGRYVAEQVTLPGGTPGDAAGSAVVLWDVQARKEVRRFTGNDGGVAVAWAPTGLLLATTNGTQTLIWLAADVEQPGGDVAPVAKLTALDKNDAITGLAWAKDGVTLAMVDEYGLGIWQPVDQDTWRQVKYFKDGGCATMLCGRRVLWSPDGKYLTVTPWHDGGASGVGLWAADGWSQQLLKASAALAWSPDSSLLLVRNQDETTLSAVQVGRWTTAWKLDPNASLHQGYRVFPQAAGWSPDGHWLVSSADGWVNLWPLDTLKSAWVWEEQESDKGIYTATGLAWSPKGGTLAVTTDGTARLTLYDLSNPAPPVGGPGF